MGKRDRANLERLLRRAWQFQHRNQIRPEESKTFPRELMAFVFAVIVALPSFAVDDPWMIFGCLFVSWIAFLYFCKIYFNTARKKMAWALAFTAGFCVVAGRIEYRRIKTEREQVANKLDISAVLPESGKPFGTTFSFTNGSDFDIGKHQTYCSPIRVVSDKHWVIDGSVNLAVPSGPRSGARFEYTYPTDFPIRAGQSQSDKCFLERFEIGNIVCADLLVGIDYQIAGLPFFRESKRNRFVFRANEGSGWVKQSPDFIGPYCPKDY